MPLSQAIVDSVAEWVRRVQTATGGITHADDGAIGTLLNEFYFQLIVDSDHGALVVSSGITRGGSTFTQLTPAVERLQLLYNRLFEQRYSVEKRVSDAKKLLDDFNAWEAQSDLKKVFRGGQDASSVEAQITKLLTERNLTLDPDKDANKRISRVVLRGAGASKLEDPRLTPDEYWGQLEEAFDTLNRLVVQCRDVFVKWGDALTQSEQQYVAAVKLAAELGEQLPELADAKKRLDDWKKQVYGDPLGAQANASSNIITLIDAANLRLHERKRERERLASRFSQADATLAELKQLSARVDAVVAQCRRDIAEPALPARPGAGELPGLESWLARIRTNFDQKIAVGALVTGMNSWEAQAAQFKQKEVAVEESCATLVADRANLRGVYETCQTNAKLKLMPAWRRQELGSTNTFMTIDQDPELVTLAARLDLLLYHGPDPANPRRTPLAEAERLVRQYADRYRRLSNG